MNKIKFPLTVKGLDEFRPIEDGASGFEAIVIKDQEEEIAYVPTDLKPNPEAIAAFVVLACNAHTALKAACEALLSINSSGGYVDMMGQLAKATDMARAAIAQAGEEQ